MNSQPYFKSPQPPARRAIALPWASLLPIVLLILGGALLAGCSPAGGADTPAEQPAGQAAVTEPASPAAPSEATLPPPAPATAEPAGQPPTASAGDTVTLPAAPIEIGEIVFAPEVNANREAVNPELFFARGITQVHAIFSYSGMEPGYTWERVWLLNDKEVSRAADTWTGPESGVFDYSIDNGGRALPAGDWVLQIYVEGQLRSVGVFIVE